MGSEVKRFHLLLALAGLAALMFAVPNATAAKQGASGKTKRSVSIVDTSQAKVRSTGKVRVKVTVRVSRKAPKKLRKTPQKVSLSGTGYVIWSPKSNRVMSGSTKVRPNRPKTITLKLNAYGRKIVSDCGAPTLKVKAGFHIRKRVEVLKSNRKLAPQKSLCDVPADVDLSQADKCDFIDAPGNACLAPFPSDFYTREDGTSETGKRLDLDPEATPANANGINIAVTVINQSDGFSPGPMLTVKIPGMDNQAAFTQSGIVPIGQMSRTFEPSQPVVLIDAETGERQLIWAELDSNATTDEDRNLIIRPGKNLKNGHRYIVAIRNLKDASGNAIAAPAGFRLYRDSDRTGNSLVESRRAHFESIFSDLAAAGIQRSSLYLAWDFTVASTENLTGRMLSIRDRAFAELGDTNLTDGIVQGDAPDFNVTEVIDYAEPGRKRRREHPDRQGHLHRSLLSEPDQLPVRRDLRSRRRPEADPHGEQHNAGALFLQRSPFGGRGCRT